MASALTLSGIRVLDLGNRPATAWCGRLLADFGAEVIGVEDDAGHPLRSQAPFDQGGTSIAARYFLASRKLASPEDVEPLIRQADIVITSDLASARYGPGKLLALNESALVCAITPYGITGEQAAYPGNDLTACAASSWAHVNGLEGRLPLKSSGYQASYQAGTFAFGVLLGCLIEKLATAAPGQVIDISEREVLVSTAAPAPLRYQYSGVNLGRKPAVDVNEGPIPVKDGWFALTISRPAFWIKAMEVLGLPDLAADPELQQPGLRHKFKDRFVSRVGEAMQSWNRMDLFDALGAQRVIAGPVLRMDELADNPQFRGRQFFRRNNEGVSYPGPIAAMGVSQFVTPEFGTTRVDRFAGPGPTPTRPVRAGAAGQGPLAGFRGLVLTQAWAGTYATELLALLGAEVIQLETRSRLDSWRGTYQNPIPKNLQARETAQHAWNCSPLYNSVNLNKQCITLDLSEPGAALLFRRMVSSVDFVAENFSPRVMKNLGIDYETLKAIKPDLVMASLSAYGATGPWAHVPGIGGTIEPSSGMSALLGYKDEHPLNSGQMYPDPVAGLCGFSAIQLALLHRDRTGQGQYIDLSMQEANFTFVGDAWLEYELTGHVRGPLGNTHSTFAPHGIFPAAGDDAWIAIAAETDAQWQIIADTLGIDPRPFATQAERKAAEADLEKLVGQKTAAQDKHDLAARLASAGVPAAAVLTPAEVAEDPALRARGHMQKITHPEAGDAWQSVLAASFSQSVLGPFSHAPLQGEHSRSVLETLAGLGAEEYAVLCEKGISGVGPSPRASVANQA
ncbi:MAG: CoA transferase [Pseudomonadota bacterium]